MIGVAADGRVHGVEVDDGGLGVVVDILETRNMTKDKPRIFFKWVTFTQSHIHQK